MYTCSFKMRRKKSLLVTSGTIIVCFQILMMVRYIGYMFQQNRIDMDTLFPEQTFMIETIGKNSTNNQTLCPETPPGLVGKINLNIEAMDALHYHIKRPDIDRGGEWRPPNCRARFKIAVIIPYRDRLNNLVVLLPTLHHVLTKQQIHYRLFVAEQEGTDTFNKGRVMNAAFIEAVKRFDCDCVVFHDADLVPENDKNLYICPQEGHPRHMSTAVSTLKYKNPYNILIGGVMVFLKEQYIKVNGYSNEYWGWGGEDDDIAYRIENSNYTFVRSAADVGRYSMLGHVKQDKNPERLARLSLAKKRQKVDGVSTVGKFYTLAKITERTLLTHLLINVGKRDQKTFTGKPCRPWEGCTLKNVAR